MFYAIIEKEHPDHGLRVELHCAADRKEVEAREAMSRAIKADSPNRETTIACWQDDMEELGAIEVKVTGVI